MNNGPPTYAFSEPYYVIVMGGVSQTVAEWVALERENTNLLAQNGQLIMANADWRRECTTLRTELRAARELYAKESAGRECTSQRSAPE